MNVGEVWQQTLPSGVVRLYLVVVEPRCYPAAWTNGRSWPQITLLDLERGKQRRINSERVAGSSWKLFEP